MHIRLLIFLIFMTNFCLAQNLVPNPSFEDTFSCPTGVPDLDGTVKFWYSARNSPDYFNLCSGTEGFYNSFGFQPANTGNAYTGFGAYQTTAINIQEQLGIELLSQLTIGQKYYLSFFLSMAYTESVCNIATNKMGALLSVAPILDYFGQFLPSDTSIVQADSILSDTINWIRISGSFIADSAYKYLTIGALYEDNKIDTIQFPYQFIPVASYYYLDDVCITTDSLYSINWTMVNDINFFEKEINIFPNPTQGQINIESSNTIYSITIFDPLGQIVYYKDNIYTNKFRISILKFKPQIYSILINNSNGLYSSHIILTN